MKVNPLIRFFAILTSGLVFLVVSCAPKAHAAQPPICYGTDQYTVVVIQAVQTALKVYADGFIGPKSCSALIAFQQSNEPPLIDAKGNFGRLGPKTLAALGVAVSSELNSIPKDCPKRKCVVVDQNSNQVRAYSPKGSLLRTGGMIDNPAELPKGTYVIGWKNKPHIAHEGKLLLENYQQFFGNVGFHKIPVTLATGKRFHDESILGTNKAASSGCIRLGSEFSDWLWQFASIGTKVVVI
ncbi:L,D-transpeptidase family protein [Candidatus Saccharibacteria bacterium]|nr:L,D-transpeptidase family protein [Candidatus Saccharibacteria bacterium]